MENSLEKKKRNKVSKKRVSIWRTLVFMNVWGILRPCPQLKLVEILKRVRLAIFEDIYEGWCFKSVFCTMSVVSCRFVVNF